MKLVRWYILISILCNVEQIIEAQQSQLSENDVDQPKSSKTPLDGKHLRMIIAPLPGITDMEKNSTGHVVQVAGTIPLALEWLSRRYNFTYSYIPIINPIFVEDVPNQRGGINILRQGEAEFFAAAIVGTASQFQNADFSSSWMSSPFSILIPIPKSSTNVRALIEPMRTEVWICIGLSIPTVMLSLFGLSKCIVSLNKKMKSNQSKKNVDGNFKATDYVVSVILSQGGYCAKKQLAIRLAAAAWCLACFVLVQAYSSTLIAFITSPNTKPIINSVYDIPNVSGLKITVSRNFAPDVMLQQTNFGVFKKLGDSLREDPSLRCNATETCLDKVRTGNYVYIHVEPVIKNIIAKDRKQTGTCQFTTATAFWPSHLYFLLPKKSPYTETINRGILKMHETGLLDKWKNDFNPVSKECSLKKKKIRNPQISLKNLTSAFILLSFGICLSILIFLAELIYHRFKFHSA